MTAFTPLAEEPRWVAWRNERRGGKATKVPHDPKGGRAKADDPTTWGTRSEAEAKAAEIVKEQGGGVGIELGDLGGDLYLAGADLDSCIGPDRSLAPWAEVILAELDTYAETSPSGTGIKAYFYCANEHVRRFLELLGVTDQDQWGVKRSVGEGGRDHGPAVEIYFSHRYFAVTEQLFPGKPDRIALLDLPIFERLAKLIPPARSGPGGGDTSRSAKAFREGARLRREGRTFEEICEALRRHSDPDIRAWCREKGEANGMRELRRIWERAAPPPAPDGDGVSLADFYAHMPTHEYIFVPSRELWPASSVNGRFAPIPVCDAAGKPARGDNGRPLTLSPSRWLDQNRPVEQMTWAPGLPMIIHDRLISEGGWFDRPGVSCFNLFRPPTLVRGDPKKVRPWISHLRKIYPDDAKRIICWFAQRVQRPEEKINHALVLGGDEGIGKDSLLEPVRRAVGPWNCREISPPDVFGQFNGFRKSVVLHISEASDLGEFDRFKFCESTKILIAAPPDVLSVNEKHRPVYYVPNCCGVIITTNHRTDSLYLAASDRRHFMCWSPRVKDDFKQTYWDKLWRWYDNGGDQNVFAYLAQFDISAFDPKAPPPRTPTFWAIINSNRPPEDAELADALDLLNNPDAVTLAMIVDRASHELVEWLKDRKNRRIIPHRLENCGYVPVRNPDAGDGMWKIGSRRLSIYAKRLLPLRDQIEAVKKLIETQNERRDVKIAYLSDPRP
jgi:hypothetical protein